MFIDDVRKRYKRSFATGQIFTLFHRDFTTSKEINGGALSSLIKSRFHAMNRQIERRFTAWNDFSVRTDRAIKEQDRKIEKRVDFVYREGGKTAKDVNDLRREIDKIARKEAEQKRLEELTPKEHLPVTVKEAGKMVKTVVERSEYGMIEEIDEKAKRSVSEAVRIIRADQYYEQLRKGSIQA